MQYNVYFNSEHVFSNPSGLIILQYNQVYIESCIIGQSILFWLCDKTIFVICSHHSFFHRYLIGFLKANNRECNFEICKSSIQEFFQKIWHRKRFETTESNLSIDVALKDPICTQSLVAAFIIGFRSEVNLYSTELFLFSRTCSYD